VDVVEHVDVVLQRDVADKNVVLWVEEGEGLEEDQWGNRKVDKPFRVRRAAYDAMLAARVSWLKSADLRKTLEDLDIPRKLHSVVIKIDRSVHKRLFLEMMEILSEDEHWLPYLRKAMDIWLPLHHEGPERALRIFINVGKLLLPGHSVDKSLEEVLEDEWAAVPGRDLEELTVGLLGPLAEITEQFKKQLFFTEYDRGAVLAKVRGVIPSLGSHVGHPYADRVKEVRHIIDNLVIILEEPIAQPIGRRSTFW